jgi:hypothetical protein
MGDIFSMNPTQSNLQQLMPATMMGGRQQMAQQQPSGFLSGFSQSFKPAPMSQNNIAWLNTLGGNVAPITGGLY